MGQRDDTYHVDEQKVIWRVIDGEAVIVHAETAQYFGTNQSGAVLWARLITGPAAVDDLGRVLQDRFGLGVDDARTASANFLDKAVEADLVVEGAVATSEPSVEPPELPDAPFEVPSLVRFGDLDALVLSGE